MGSREWVYDSTGMAELDYGNVFMTVPGTAEWVHRSEFMTALEQQNGIMGMSSLEKWQYILECVSVNVFLHDWIQVVFAVFPLHRAWLSAQSHDHTQVVLQFLPPLLYQVGTLWACERV